MVPYERNELFVGRKDLLSRLFTQLYESKQYQYNHRVALYGLGGIGKTQTALAYLYSNRACYDSIFWISGISQASLLTDFQRIAILTKCDHDNINTDPFQYVKKVHDWLNAQISWLLVIDNLDDINVINGFLPMNDCQKHTLITTRNPNSTGIPAQGLEVPLLTPEDSVNLLSSLSNIAIVANSPEREQANQIVHELGFLPLGIEQAAAYVREVAGDFATFLNHYQENRKDVYQWMPQGNRSYAHSVATTWLMSFNIVRSNNSLAAELFQLLSFFNPDGILIDFLQSGVEALQEDLRKVVSNRIDMSKALMELERFSLLKWSRPAKTLLLHRLVQAVVRDEMSNADLMSFRTTIINLCDRSFPQKGTNEKRATRRVYLGQVMVPLLDPDVIRSEKSVNVMIRVGCFLRDDGKFDDSERLLLQATIISGEILGPEHPGTLSSMNNLAVTYRAQGKTAEAAELHEEVLQKRRRILGDDHPDTLTTMDNLAATYQAQGKTAEAAELHEEVLQKRTGGSWGTTILIRLRP
jgi:tetratricopeptide (TPR) repeat protein